MRPPAQLPRAPERPPPTLISFRTASRRLTFLAGVTRVIAIVASNPQDPVLYSGYPVGGRLDIHRERGAAAPGAAGCRSKRGARELLQVLLPPPPLVLMLQLVLQRPSSDSTARRSSGFASQQRRQRRRQRNGPHSGRSLCQSGSSPPATSSLLPKERPLTSDAHSGLGRMWAPHQVPDFHH